MNAAIYAVLVLLPVVGGALIPILPFRKRNHRLIYTEGIVLLNSILAILTLIYRPKAQLTLFRFTSNLSISFQLDDLGAVFVALIAILWPFATLYAFEYMKHEEHENTFFMFYVITYGVTMGIALAEDAVTMYCFYELLTLITVPLVMHTLTREAVLASRTYLYYMIGGAAFAFIGLVFILVYGTTADFVPGGVLDMAKLGDKTQLALLIYVICFCGFSVKAAMWPFSGWLPKASVAPTPVTALLHAVAVVKAGAFTIMRITYYSFGTELLRGTWAQAVVMILTIITIVYGCSRAVKETHLKRRLAWSTVSNLSYILFGVTLMTPAGLVGALCHMLFHAFMKISMFFCAGAIIYKSGKEYIFELDGLGRKMPKTFLAFTISAMALMGVPGLCGFVSKWKLAEAAVAADTPLALLGVAAILVSALLTAIYTFTIIVRAFVPAKPVAAAAAGTGSVDIEMTQEEAVFENSTDAVTETVIMTKQTAVSEQATVTAVSEATVENVSADADNKADTAHEADAAEVTDPSWMMLFPLGVFVIVMFAIGLHPQPIISFFESIAQAL